MYEKYERKIELSFCS